ncbi:hypothetical protein MN116_005034 [Schistosoma mekongi]|uniref:Sodium-dependent dopamine transporter n=1 Tax=Schistosoma mekongi TaxID=38744 RepID=A0AAE2D4Y0_SCHME|nr:hypothetical protein MN116_005034 [Schistosoma mekongi]
MHITTSVDLYDESEKNNVNFNEVKFQPNYIEKNDLKTTRNNFSSRVYFLLSSISFAVDLTTVFRFPYLCYVHGGAAFLIAYLIMLTFCVVPLFYLELLVGQYFQQGCVSLWKIALLFKGIGWASCIITFLASLYYNTIISWAFYYLFSTFQSELPWTNCNHSWNAPTCHELSMHNLSFYDSTISTPTREFFEIKMLGVDKVSGFGDFGSVQWEVCGCLFTINFLLFLSLFKGVKVLEKVSWITAGVPYLAMVVLLIRGLTLNDALYGVKTFLTPSFEKLSEWKLWFDASSQAFFSLGVGFGVHVAYGSYNVVNRPVYIDCVFTTAMNACISLLNSITLYSFMGYLSQYYAIPIHQIFDGNLGLIFIVYTNAFDTLSASHLWCVLLFAMLVTLGLGSSIGATESFLTAVYDECTIFKLNTKKYFRLGLVTAFLISSFLISILTVCQGGYYLVHYLDHYACGTSLILVSLFQCFAIVYVYGIYNLSENINGITNKPMYFVTRFILKFCVPLILIFMLTCEIVTSTNLIATIGGKEYRFADWTVKASWVLVLVAILPIPINMIAQILHTRKLEETWYLRIAMLITPPKEYDGVKKIGYCERLKIKHWLKI